MNSNPQIKSLVRNFISDIHWFFKGAFLNNPPINQFPKSVLFICMGNICRSPFAHYYGASLLPGGPQSVIFDSAGVRVDEARPSPANAIEAASLLGVDLSRHQSKPATQALIAKTDVVLAMEHWQIKELAMRFPEYTGKFHLLPLYIPYSRGTGLYDHYNIKDPYNQDLTVFIESFQRIQLAIFSLLKLISEPRNVRAQG